MGHGVGVDLREKYIDCLETGYRIHGGSLWYFFLLYIYAFAK